MKKTAKPASSACASIQLESITQLWMLRMLVPLAGHKELVNRRGFSDDAVARAAGLGKWVDEDEDDFDGAEVRSQLQSCYERVERDAKKPGIPAELGSNIERLALLVGLSEVDCRILEFAVMLHQDRVLDDCADMLGQVTCLKIPEVLAQLLQLDIAPVRASLGSQGVLARSGLLVIDRGNGGFLRSKLDLISNNFASLIIGGESDPMTLLRDTVAPSPAARLGLDDYQHIERQLALLRPYLARSMAAGRIGVNIFMVGAPGTGKSELARALAGELGCELFEVASEDSDGDAVLGERRLRAYRAAQSFFGRRNAMIVFDEVEDVFSDGDSMFGRKSTAQRRKAWLNRTLEQNVVPTLWLSNSIDGIDPAFLRRFDMVVELPVPPRRQRESIIREASAGLLDEGALVRIASSADLAPAVVSRAIEVVRVIGDAIAPSVAAQAVEFLIDQSLEAQGHQSLSSGSAARLPAEYDVTLINTDADMLQLANGLSAAASARLCLYGPPGTGKTAFGRWVADRIGAPLLLYTASELISKWVGESEKNIAAAFKRAQSEHAVLMIDEVDSFLRDRSQARQSWEVTMVNEMLTRMETYSGVFIASTNLMDILDPAALRRFDLKVGFGFLKPDQAEMLLDRYTSNLSLASTPALDRQRLRALHKLTPGDFAAVARQHRFRPVSSSSAFVSALASECALKSPVSRSIGFLG